MMRPLRKEVCGCCHKNISLGQSITECQKCNWVIHSRCYKKSSFKLVNNTPYCQNCCQLVKVIYNPFQNLDGIRQMDNLDTDGSDKSYNNDITEIIDDLSVISSLLNSCREIQSIVDLNKLLDQNPTSDKTFSTFFQNVDGNKSNFDNFATNIHQIQHKFSIIGLAETNVDPSNKDLYMLDDYTSIYQEIDPIKFKGTGVALYVHDSLNATINANLSQSSSNLESLFVTIHNGSQKLTVGVIYSPPSRDVNQFLVELGLLLGKCPSRNVYIMGDFNIYLHKLDSENSRAFEDSVLSNGLFPLISLCTHAKPDCRETCILL